MSGGFSFPPPPPPPSKLVQTSGGQQGQQQDSWLGDRGRGRDGPRGRFGQRGRGQSGGRGSYASNSHQQSGLNHYDRSAVSQQTNDPIAHNQQRSHNHVGSQSQHKGTLANPVFPVSTSRPINHSGNPYAQNGPYELYGHSNALGQHQSKVMSPPRTTAGHKRKLDALRSPPQDRAKKPGPQTAPAVPSFGAPFLPSPHVLPSKSLQTKQTDAKPKPPAKSLGLIPRSADALDVSTDSEDGKEVDEEAMHAELGDQLTFEHNGVVLSLKSQADLSAWKKDRRKNWPTQARMMEREEERRSVGIERKRLLAAAESLQGGSRRRDSKPKVRRQASFSTRPSVWVKDQDKPAEHADVEVGNIEEVASSGSNLDKAQRQLKEQEVRLNDLRRKVAESELRNREAKAQKAKRDEEVAAQEAEADQGTSQVDIASVPTSDRNTTQPEDTADQDGDISEESIPDSSPELSSSSGLDVDSDDEPPEEVSSKPAPTAPPEVQRPLCRHFAARGYCRDGDACGFRHEQRPDGTGEQRQVRQQQQDDRASKPPPIESNIERKSIFQRLVDQEQDEEDKLALQVVKYLGKAGLFKASEEAEVVKDV